MDEAFDARLQLDERTVVGDVRDGALIFLPSGNLVPISCHGSDSSCFMPSEIRWVSWLMRMICLDRLTDVEDLGRMVDTAPRHVGDVQQTVDATEVNERAVVGDVLDDALEPDPLRGSGRSPSAARHGSLRERCGATRRCCHDGDPSEDLEGLRVVHERVTSRIGRMSTCERGRNATAPTVVEVTP